MCNYCFTFSIFFVFCIMTFMFSLFLVHIYSSLVLQIKLLIIWSRHLGWTTPGEFGPTLDLVPVGPSGLVDRVKLRVFFLGGHRFTFTVRAVHCSVWTGTGPKTGPARPGPDRTVYNRSGPMSCPFSVSVFGSVRSRPRPVDRLC